MTIFDVSLGLHYYGDDLEIETCLLHAIGKLPEDVAEFALEYCRFFSIGRQAIGTAFKAESLFLGEIKDMYIILLDERCKKKDAASVCAHEIAHAWLGHDALDENPFDVEIQAANLTKEWGFTGIGADAVYCNRNLADLVSVYESKPKAKK